MFLSSCYFLWAILLAETFEGGRGSEDSSFRKESLFLKKPVIYLVNVVCQCPTEQCNYPQPTIPYVPNPNVPNPNPPIDPPDYDPSPEPGDLTTPQPFPPQGQPQPEPGNTDPPPGRLDITGNSLSADQQVLIHQAILASLRNARNDGPRVRFLTVLRPFNQRSVVNSPFMRIGQFSKRRNQNIGRRMAIERLPHNLGLYNVGGGHVNPLARNSMTRYNNTRNSRKRHRESFENLNRPRPRQSFVRG